MDFFVDFLLNFYGPTPYLIILAVLLACGLGLPVPEDVTLFAAGLLAYYGVTKLWLIIGISLFGVMAGDCMIFYLGAKYGRKLAKGWFFGRLFPPDRLQAVSDKFKKKGDKLLFAARFMPGFRAPVFFSAGTLHVPFRKFFFYDGMAALISVPAIILAVYWFGDQLDRVVRIIKRIEHGIFFVILAVILAMFLKWYVTHRRIKKGRKHA
ncbi:MAG: SNARE associated protein [Bdellovibrionales bacterium RIFOXYD1_FULL_53_11]|nr:MAG: SNARE associated protein [Bdellovibrionales bacterium RIFOXYD1_FULL_53_11]